MILYLQLFWEFFKTGLFAVGGGLATLPFLYDMGSRYGWFTTEDVADMIAVSESTPGPMGINMATYVGHKMLGTFGGVFTTLSLVLPSVIVIIIISKILKKFKESAVVQKVFYGLRPASTGLIAAAGLGIGKIALLKVSAFQESGIIADLFNWKCIILAAFILITLKAFNKHPIVYIIAAAIAGIVFQL